MNSWFSVDMDIERNEEVSMCAFKCVFSFTQRPWNRDNTNAVCTP